MRLEISPNLGTLIKKRLSSGAYANAEEVVRHALEEQDAQDKGVDANLAAHLEEGCLQTERGEVTDSEKAWLAIAEMKAAWHSSR